MYIICNLHGSWPHFTEDLIFGVNLFMLTERRTNHCLRLCGALSIMVLLGVPWIFSAFGAIDANEENVSLQTTEGVFHVTTSLIIHTMF